MKQNRSLLIAFRFLQLCFGLACLMFIAFNTVMFMGFTDSAFGKQISIADPGKPDASVSLSWCKGDCGDSSESLQAMAPEMKVWILIRTGLFFVLSMLIMWRGIVLLRSIKEGKTFYEENILAFSQMAKFGLIFALLSAVNFHYLGQVDMGSSIIWSLDVPFAPLLFALGCKVLAEIFKQGKLLSEENQSFV